MLFYGGTEGRDFSSTMCLFEVVEEKKKYMYSATVLR